MQILIINGPNLNLLGKRETTIYGELSFDVYLKSLIKLFPSVVFEYFQSNHEGEIIDKLHKTDGQFDGIVLNAGAYTHTSLAIADAISAISISVIEVHISNIFKREKFRHKSFLSPVCVGIISGFGLDSYRLAVEYYLKRLKK